MRKRSIAVDAWGLPANTEFDTFVIPVPNFPFGCPGTKATFAIAPNSAPAPSVHSSPTPDATTNPAFGPVHTFHIGIWFTSPADAAQAGCSGATTPFNGEHNAGVQVFNTAQFPATAGPLGTLEP